MIYLARVYDSRIGVRSALTQYRRAFELRGRATRSELISFWIVALFVSLAIAWSWALISVKTNVSSNVAAAVLQILALLPFVPWPALLARRMHDENRSGWWVVLLFALLIAGNALTGRSIEESSNGLGVVLGFTASLANFIFSFAPGTYGPNTYGADPRLEYGR